MNLGYEIFVGGRKELRIFSCEGDIYGEKWIDYQIEQQ